MTLWLQFSKGRHTLCFQGRSHIGFVKRFCLLAVALAAVLPMISHVPFMLPALCYEE